MDKIAKAQGRAAPEWRGKTPDSKAPPSVVLRVLRRQGNKCALTAILIADGQPVDCDHIQSLEDGGENRENNLQVVLRLPHEIKTAAERKRQAKSDRIAKAAHSLKSKGPPIKSRGFETTKKPAHIEKQPLPPRSIYR